MPVLLEGFEKFTGTRQHNAPMVSIKPNGILGLNAAASRQFKLAAYNWAVLHYNRAGRQVAIELTYVHEPGALRLTHRKDKVGADISAKSFCDFYGLLSQRTQQLTPELRNADPVILILDLNQAREQEMEPGEGGI